MNTTLSDVSKRYAALAQSIDTAKHVERSNEPLERFVHFRLYALCMGLASETIDASDEAQCKNEIDNEIEHKWSLCLPSVVFFTEKERDRVYNEIDKIHEFSDTLKTSL